MKKWIVCSFSGTAHEVEARDFHVGTAGALWFYGEAQDNNLGPHVIRVFAPGYWSQFRPAPEGE